MAVENTFTNCVSQRGSAEFVLSSDSIIYLKSLQLFSDTVLLRAPATVLFFGLNKLMIDYPFLGTFANEQTNSYNSKYNTSIFNNIMVGVQLNGNSYSMTQGTPAGSKTLKDLLIPHYSYILDASGVLGGGVSPSRPTEPELVENPDQSSDTPTETEAKKKATLVYPDNQLSTIEFDKYPLKYLGDEFFASYSFTKNQYLEYSYFGFTDHKGEYVFDVKTTYNYVKHRKTKYSYFIDESSGNEGIMAYYYDTMSFNLICDKYFRQIGEYRWSIEKNVIVDTEWFITRKNLREYNPFAIEYFSNHFNYSKFNENGPLRFYAMPEGVAGSKESNNGCDCACDNCVSGSNGTSEPQLVDDRIVYEEGERPTDPEDNERYVRIVVYTLELNVTETSPGNYRQDDSSDIQFDNGCELFGTWKSKVTSEHDYYVDGEEEPQKRKRTIYTLDYDWDSDAPQTFNISFIGGPFTTKNGKTHADIPALGEHYVLAYKLHPNNMDYVAVNAGNGEEYGTKNYWKGNLKLTIDPLKQRAIKKVQIAINFSITLNSEQFESNLLYSDRIVDGDDNNDKPSDEEQTPNIFVGEIKASIYTQQYTVVGNNISLTNSNYLQYDRGNSLDVLIPYKNKGDVTVSKTNFNGMPRTVHTITFKSSDAITINSIFNVIVGKGSISSVYGDVWKYNLVKIAINDVEQDKKSLEANNIVVTGGNDKESFNFKLSLFNNKYKNPDSEPNTLKFYFGEITSGSAAYELSVSTNSISFESSVNVSPTPQTITIVSKHNGAAATPTYNCTSTHFRLQYKMAETSSGINQIIIVSPQMSSTIRKYEADITITLGNKKETVHVLDNVKAAQTNASLTITFPCEITKVVYRVSTSTTLTNAVMNTITGSTKQGGNWVASGSLKFEQNAAIKDVYVWFDVYLNAMDANTDYTIYYVPSSGEKYKKVSITNPDVNLTVTDFAPFALVSINSMLSFKDVTLYMSSKKTKGPSGKVEMEVYKDITPAKVMNNDLENGFICLAKKGVSYPVYVAVKLRTQTINGGYSFIYSDLVEVTSSNQQILIKNFVVDQTWNGDTAAAMPW